MTKKKLWLGILVMTLAFGMAGCASLSGGIDPDIIGIWYRADDNNEWLRLNRNRRGEHVLRGRGSLMLNFIANDGIFTVNMTNMGSAQGVYHLEGYIVVIYLSAASAEMRSLFSGTWVKAETRMGGWQFRPREVSPAAIAAATSNATAAFAAAFAAAEVAAAEAAAADAVAAVAAAAADIAAGGLGGFTVTRSRDGTSVAITGHTGTIPDMVIPPELQGLPVTHIGEYAFWDRNLTSITIPDSVVYIGRSAFQHNRLTSVIIPANVAYIGQSAFYGNQLSSVAIPDNVTYIGQAAFWGNHLSSVSIGNNVSSIGPWAFGGNRLTNVTVPLGVASIGDDAFDQGVTVTRN